MTPQETIRALANHVKAAVFPHLGTWRARKVTGIANSGDATFDIDDIAEGAVEEYYPRPWSERRLLFGGSRPGTSVSRPHARRHSYYRPD